MFSTAIIDALPRSQHHWRRSSSQLPDTLCELDAGTVRVRRRQILHLELEATWERREDAVSGMLITALQQLRSLAVAGIMAADGMAAAFLEAYICKIYAALSWSACSEGCHPKPPNPRWLQPLWAGSSTVLSLNILGVASLLQSVGARLCSLHLCLPAISVAFVRPLHIIFLSAFRSICSFAAAELSNLGALQRLTSLVLHTAYTGIGIDQQPHLASALQQLMRLRRISLRLPERLGAGITAGWATGSQIRAMAALSALERLELLTSALAAADDPDDQQPLLPG